MSSIVIGTDIGVPAIVLTADEARLRDAHFDNDCDSWTLTTLDGRTMTARTLIDARPSPDITVANHGMPNFFRVPGPDASRQIKFVKRCLEVMQRSGATRMEAKSRILLRRWRPQPVESRFYLTGLVPGDDDVYDGTATVDGGVPVRARLTGHLDAYDGHYHWRGTIDGELPADLLKGQRTLTLSIDGACAQARVVERTPWGGYSVAGVGEPPYALA